MYSTCIFCHGALGANEAIEHFPVGRRLAFDPERGRLWVVCRRCSRWNLTPLEERWEAIEDCERLFRDTRVRISTDHIGLARLGEGTELVRVGRPQRPEFAAWRYSDQFGRRRRAMMVKAGLGVGVVGAVVAGGVAAGAGIGGFGWMVWRLLEVAVKGSPTRIVAQLDRPTGAGQITVRGKHLPYLRLEPEGADGWSLGVPSGKKQLVYFRDDVAVRTAARLLPQLNRYGGTQDGVRQAVSLIEDVGDPMRYFARAARLSHHAGRLADYGQGAETGRGGAKPLAGLPEPVRLALEMAAHEDQERRAMEGELAILEAAWRDAEEIAKISDDLLLPESVRKYFGRQ
jgi:hypothetical protein